MKLISISHKYIQQTILYIPLGIQHSARISSTYFQIPFNIKLNPPPSPHPHTSTCVRNLRPPPQPLPHFFHFADVDRPHCDISY